MKRLWISLAILLALLTAALGNIRSVSGLSGQLCALLNRAEACAEAGDWEQAGGLTRQAQARWERSAAKLYMVQCHGTGDEITSGFRQVLECIQWRAVPEYSANNGALIADVEHLAEQERLTLRNLL